MKQHIVLLPVVFALAVTAMAQSAAPATASNSTRAALQLSDLQAEQAQYDHALAPHNTWAADYAVRLKNHDEQTAKQNDAVAQESARAATYQAAVAAHNANVCRAPANDPGQCAAYNEERDRLDAEKAFLESWIAQLNAEAPRLNAEKASMDIEHDKINAEKVQLDLAADRLNADIAAFMPRLSKDVEPKITAPAAVDAALDKVSGEWNVGVCSWDKSFNVLHLVVVGKTITAVASGVPNTDTFHDRTKDPFVWTFAEAENRDGAMALTYSVAHTLSKDSADGATGDSVVSFVEVDPISSAHWIGLYERSNDTKKKVVETRTSFAVRSVGFTDMEAFAKTGQAVCNNVSVLPGQEQTAYLKNWAATNPASEVSLNETRTGH